MAIPLLPELRNNPDEATAGSILIFTNYLGYIIYTCLVVTDQCPEYECDTNSHKKRHVVINVAAWLVPRVNTRVRGTRSY